MADVLSVEHMYASFVRACPRRQGSSVHYVSTSEIVPPPVISTSIPQRQQTFLRSILTLTTFHFPNGVQLQRLCSCNETIQKCLSFWLINDPGFLKHDGCSRRSYQSHTPLDQKRLINPYGSRAIWTERHGAPTETHLISPKM